MRPAMNQYSAYSKPLTNLHISSTSAVYFSKYNGSDIYYQSFKLISWSPTPPKKNYGRAKTDKINECVVRVGYKRISACLIRRMKL